MWGHSEKTGCPWTSKWALTRQGIGLILDLGFPCLKNGEKSISECFNHPVYGIFVTTASSDQDRELCARWHAVCLCLRVSLSAPSLCHPIRFAPCARLLSHCARRKSPLSQRRSVGLHGSFSDSDSLPGRLEDELLSDFFPLFFQVAGDLSHARGLVVSAVFVEAPLVCGSWVRTGTWKKEH